LQNSVESQEQWLVDAAEQQLHKLWSDGIHSWGAEWMHTLHSRPELNGRNGCHKI
jgi:hypothetical protein